MMDWINTIKENDKNEILTFQEYMDYFTDNPKSELRTSAKYFYDVFNYFKKDKQDQFNLFHTTNGFNKPVFGQTKPQNKIYQHLSNFIEEGFNFKFILLIGPNGSAKTSIIQKIMEGAEEYSKTDPGKLYTFSWIFPIDNLVKGSLGLNSRDGEQNLDSYAKLEDKEISSILISEFKDHPLLLIPTESRQKIIDSILISDQKQLELIKKTYLYNGDLSKKNRLIFDTLSKNYKGDVSKVLKHIRVERYFLSKRYSEGAVTIEPQLHIDAKMQQITIDRRLANLPPSLQSLNLFNMQGELVMSNRGILEFSDLLKRPLDTFKYLLMTMETRKINLQGHLSELDIFFIGSSNEIHFSAFKQHPDFNSFKGRFEFIKVGYLLDFSEEMKIYKKQITDLKNKTTFNPHALETLCIWAIMTRLRQPNKKNYTMNKKLGELVESLSPLEKTLLVSKNIVPQRFHSDDKQILKENIKLVENEFLNEHLYEGKFGVSPREIKQIIYSLSEIEEITVLDVIEFLGQFVHLKNEYDFLNIAPQGAYHNNPKFLLDIKNYQLNLLDIELRESLGLIDDTSYEEYIKKYIEHINAFLKKEKIKNPITGEFENSDKFFMEEFEKNINLKEDPMKFRSYTLSKLGAYSLDNPSGEIQFTKVFPQLVDELKESFRFEQKKLIQEISKNIIFYESELQGQYKNRPAPLGKEQKELIEKVIKNLKEKHGYSQVAALTLLKYLIKERY